MTRYPFRPCRALTVPALTAALAALLCTLFAAPPAHAGERPQPDLLSRDYAPRHLSLVATEALLWQACPEDEAAYCVVDDSKQEGHARLIAPPAVQRRAVALLAAHDVPAGAYTLRVDLLAVERGGRDRLEGLAPSARRRVEALRGELGGPSFTLLDSGLVRTANEGRTELLADDRLYQVLIDLRRGQRGERIEVQGIQLHAQRVGGQPTSGLPAPVGAVLAASLDVAVGDTAVVGTTRLDETRDLLLLLTAAR